MDSGVGETKRGLICSGAKREGGEEESPSFAPLSSVAAAAAAAAAAEMASSELQATVEISLEFHKFYNVDLFQRG